MATGFLKKNIDYVKRNGDAPAGKTVIKYVNVQARDGISGEDAFNVQLSPNNMTFKAGSYNATPSTYYVNVYVTRGTSRINALVLDSSITGRMNGLDASTVSGTNGTLNTRIAIKTTSDLTADAGQLVIPIQYCIDAYDGSINYVENDWNPEYYNHETFDAIFSWTLGKTGASIFNLDLSNETATINCDSNGHVLANAVRPPCKATLAFGSDNNLSGVYYDASFSPSAQGICINHETGDILYDHDVHAYDNTIPDASFDFGDASTNTILNVTIDASYQGKKQAYKVMTIEKALPGQQGPSGYTPYIGPNGNWWINGEDTGVKAEGEDGSTGADAVSRWIDLSADQVKIDASNNIIPPTITATAWKQVGGNTPTTDPSCNIKWFPDSSTERAYSSAVTVNAAWNMITFKLYFGNVYIGETETVPILKDGKDGAEGPQGRRGAAIRGPVLWDSSSNVNKTGLDTRWFYCGTMSSTPPNVLEEQFIDVIMHDKQYYVCNRNYEQPSGATWTQTMSDGFTVASHWTVADASYNFVAANVILAKNAGIDFLTGNEIYLRDSDGNITAGASGGTGISFWAGGEKDENPPFQVDSSGNITATSGTFSGFVKYPYKDVLELTSNPTFNKNSITRYGTYTFDASTQYANLISRTIHHYKPSSSQGTAVPFTRNLVLPFPTEDLNGFTYNILVTMYATGNYDSNDSYWSGDSSTTDNACLHISVNSTGHQNDTRLSIDNYAFPDVWTCKNWTIEFGSATITCVPFYGNASDGQASTIVGYRWTITQASGIVTADTGGSGSGRYKHFTSLAGRSDDNVKPIYEIRTYTGTRPSPSDEDNIMFVKKNS